MLSSKARAASLWPLLLSTLIIQTGFGTILPLLPLFVKDRGMPLSWLGIMAAIYALVAFIGQLVLGPLSDIWGRKRLMLAGTILSTAGTLLFLLPVPPYAYLIFRAVQGLGVAAFIPAANALIADQVAPERQGRAFALLSSAYMAGFALGPLLGGMASAFGGLRIPFVVGGALNFVSIVAVLLGIKGTDAIARTVRTRKAAGPLPWRSLLQWLVVNFGWMGLGGMYDATWSIYMERLGASQVLIGLSWTLFALPYLLFNFPAGRLADHVSWRSRLIYSGALLNALIVLMYTLSDRVWLSMALSVAEAVAMSLITPALSAKVMAGGRGDMAGRVQGVFQASGTLGAFVMALMSGYLLPYGPKYALAAGASILLVSLALSTVWRRRSPDSA